MFDSQRLCNVHSLLTDMLATDFVPTDFLPKRVTMNKLLRQ